MIFLWFHRTPQFFHHFFELPGLTTFVPFVLGFAFGLLGEGVGFAAARSTHSWGRGGTRIRSRDTWQVVGLGKMVDL